MSTQDRDQSRREFLLAGGVLALAPAPGLANRPSPTRARGYAPWKHGLVHFYDNGGSGTPLLLLHQEIKARSSSAARSRWDGAGWLEVQARRPRGEPGEIELGPQHGRVGDLNPVGLADRHAIGRG